MQGYSLAHSSVRWSFGALSPGRPPNRVLKHTIELIFPGICEWMGEHQGESYPFMNDLHLVYHQVSTREKDRHRSTFRLHYDFLFMPLGLPNALVTFMSCKHW
jgi:hypothetical protein